MFDFRGCGLCNGLFLEGAPSTEGNFFIIIVGASNCESNFFDSEIRTSESVHPVVKGAVIPKESG